MLRVFCISILLAICSSSGAAGFTHVFFEKSVHHFGFIYESQGEVHCSFTFQNTGRKTLNIQKINSDCGCTSAIPSKNKILQGDTASMHVIFNPAGRKGTFHKNVYIYSNAMQEKITLTLTGQIIPAYIVQTDSIIIPGRLQLPALKKKKHGKKQTSSSGK
jgi:hypothetical protein